MTKRPSDAIVPKSKREVAASPPCWSAAWIARAFPEFRACVPTSKLGQVPIRHVALYFWLAKQLDLICPGLADPFISVALCKFLIRPWFDVILEFESRLSHERSILEKWALDQIKIVHRNHAVSMPTEIYVSLDCVPVESDDESSSSDEHWTVANSIAASVADLRSIVATAASKFEHTTIDAASAMASGSLPHEIAKDFFCKLDAGLVLPRRLGRTHH